MKKKGFTLIELLAVIVILAIIALITVPVVINIINNAKKGAAEDSTYGVVEAAKLFWVENQTTFESTNSDVTFECENKVCTATIDDVNEVSGHKTVTLNISGTKPSDGTIRIANGKITVTDLHFGDYYCSKGENTDKISCSKNSGSSNSEPQNNEPSSDPEPPATVTYSVTFDKNDGSSTTSVTKNANEEYGTLPSDPIREGYTFLGWYDALTEGNQLTTTTVISGDITYYAHWQAVTYTAYTLGQLIYFDPTSSNTTCSSATPSTNAETCMKWRVIETADSTSKSNITLQLDYNIVNKTAWVSKADYNDDTNYGSNGNNNKGPITALKALANETDGWANVDNLTYSYDTSDSTSNYGTLSCSNGDCTINGTALDTNSKKLKARMITGEEVAAITNTL